MQHACPKTLCVGALSSSLATPRPWVCRSFTPSHTASHNLSAHFGVRRSSFDSTGSLSASPPCLRLFCVPSVEDVCRSGQRRTGIRAQTSRTPGSAITPPSARGRPLVTPNALVAAVAFGGVSLTVFAGLAPDNIPPVFRTAAYLVYQNSGVAYKVAVAAVLVHVAEAVGTAIVGKLRGYDSKAIAWWTATAFLFGIPAILAMNQVEKGELEDLPFTGPRYKLE